MRLLLSTSPEITRRFASRQHLLVRRPIPNFHGVAGNLGVLFFLLAARRASLPYGPTLTVGLLIVWNAILLWRIFFGRHNWIILTDRRALYIRMFARSGGAGAAGSESNIVALDLKEIRSMGVQTRTIYISGPKPKILRWLVIEPDPAAQDLLTVELGDLSPPTGTCDPQRVWYAEVRDGTIRIPWQLYRPDLSTFVHRAELHFPGLTKHEITLPELDLISAVNAREPERRRLLSEAKRMGYGAYCILALWQNAIGPSLYMRRSLKECADYVATIDADPIIGND